MPIIITKTVLNFGENESPMLNILIQLQRNAKIIYANAFFGDWGDAYKAQAYENHFGWNKFGFSGQKGGIPNPGRTVYQ